MTQKERHLQALNNFVEEVKTDPNVVALLVYGSLGYGTVWERSDIDMEMIVRDGAVTLGNDYCIEQDGVLINLNFGEVSKFKKYLQAVRGGFDHGIYGKGTLIFTKDEALLEIFEEAKK